MQNLQYTSGQTAAITSSSQQTLVIAGPGSGKTAVIVARVAYLLNQGVSADKIALLTYTNAAAKEMQTRIEALLEGTAHASARLGFVGTLHSYCLRLLERYGAALGYRAGLGVVEDERADELLAAAAQSVALKTSTSALRHLRDELGTNCLEKRPQTPATLALCNYYRQLRQGNMSDFAGLLTDGARLWRMNAVPPLEHLLVDEYQDSTQADQDFYFAVHSSAFFFVGDPDQAIYSFRGGSVAALLGLSRMESWHKVWLQENHRCDAAICDAAQRLIERNTQRAPKVTISATGGLGVVELMQPARTETQEAASILTLVEKMLAERIVKPSEIAVLTRTNAAAKIIAGMSVNEYRIPLARPPDEDSLPGGWQFARATLDVLISPLNDFFFRYWLSLRDGQEAAKNLAKFAATTGKPMYELNNAGLPPVERLGGQLSAWQAVNFLDQNNVPGPSIRRVEAYLAELPCDATLSDLSLAVRAQRRNVGNENPEGVTVRTIHSAKGLEWPVVFLAAMEQEVIPGGPEHNVQEERRLVYVAATRAKHKLVLSYALSRCTTWGRKEQKEHTPSQFLSELGVL